MDIKKILKEMIARGASDLHLKVATPPCFRINGTLVGGLVGLTIHTLSHAVF